MDLPRTPSRGFQDPDMADRTPQNKNINPRARTTSEVFLSASLFSASGVHWVEPILYEANPMARAAINVNTRPNILYTVEREINLLDALQIGQLGLVSFHFLMHRTCIYCLQHGWGFIPILGVSS